MPELRPLDAPSAYEFRFATGSLEPLRQLFARAVRPDLTRMAKELAQGRVPQLAPVDGHALYTRSFNGELLWLSSDNEKTHAVFQHWFDAVDIATLLRRLVSFDRKVVMYCGFFILSFQMSRPKWHVDFLPGSNAFTLLTPLFEPAPSHGGLLFQDRAGHEQRHGYACGSGLLIGEHFRHTTQPYAWNAVPRVMLSLTAGTDRMSHWPALAKTVGLQSRFLVLPCGHRLGACGCVQPA